MENNEPQKDLSRSEKWEIISSHMRDLQKKSVKVVKEKHGPDFYKKIGKMGGRPKHKHGQAILS